LHDGGTPRRLFGIARRAGLLSHPRHLLAAGESVHIKA